MTVGPEAAGDLIALLERLREQGNRIVTTNGVFDLLHVGHLRYLQQARGLGDVLVVAVNSDESVRALKGAARPVVPDKERAELLSGLRCVDHVAIFTEPTPETLLRRIKPHIHVKGGDYREQDLPEAAAVRENGGEVVILPLTPGRSTSALIEIARTRAPSGS